MEHQPEPALRSGLQRISCAAQRQAQPGGESLATGQPDDTSRAPPNAPAAADGHRRAPQQPSACAHLGRTPSRAGVTRHTARRPRDTISQRCESFTPNAAASRDPALKEGWGGGGDNRRQRSRCPPRAAWWSHSPRSRQRVDEKVPSETAHAPPKPCSSSIASHAPALSPESCAKARRSGGRATRTKPMHAVTRGARARGPDTPFLCRSSLQNTSRPPTGAASQNKQPSRRGRGGM